MIFDDDQILVCPECAGIHTHITDVTMYARPDGEDRSCVALVVDETGTVGVRPHPGIRRRTAVEISGYCEQGHTFSFLLTQHKGSTYLTS